MSSGKNGQFLQSDFMNTVGGLNLTDSVFKIDDNEAAGGYNFDYFLTGGIRKRLGPTKINSVADTQTYSLGLGLYNTSSSVKAIIRAAGTKLQQFNPDAPSFTNLTTDTAGAISNVLTAGSTQTVNFAQFNNGGSSNILWAAGGGMSIPYGAYSTTKITQNGSAIAAGAITVTRSGAGSGVFASIGYYRYGVAKRKASTQVLSNVALDKEVQVQVVTDKVTIDLSGITGTDATQYDQYYIYRSAVNSAAQGNTEFTTGDLIAQVSVATTSYDDIGTFITTSTNVPRANNIILDNSVLPAATYNTITVFKRRLVVAQGNTILISDINKSESWPTTNVITVPSGGAITGLAVISFTSPQAQTIDELLVIFKERELWVITGTNYTDWALKFIDQVGCPEQGLIATGNGFLAWVDFRGIYLWDGTSKPTYCSRPIETLFARDGDLDKTKLAIGTGEFFRRENTILWYLSSKTFGTNKLAIKLDLRLTLPQIEQQLTGRNIDGIFTCDTYQQPVYAAMAYIPSGGSQEMMVLGDNAGFCYYASNGHSDANSAYSFTYQTKPLNMGDPNTQKLYHKVIVWAQNIGTWNLLLDYWTDFSADINTRATQALPINSAPTNAEALYDVAFYDVAYFDQYYPKVVPLVFNLEPGSFNNNQGSALTIQFRNDTADQPILIHGFSVIWSELGGVTQ